MASKGGKAASRRGKGEGSIYRRQDGRWAASIPLPDGKRKTVYAKTQAEVQRKMRDVERARDAGLPVVAEQQTVQHYLGSWLEFVRPRLEYSSWRAYQLVIERYAYPAFGKTKLARLEPRQVEDLYAQLLREGLSSSTVALLHVVVRTALKRAARLGLVARNVTDLVDAPRVRRPEMHPLDRNEARRVLDAARGDRLEALYALALSSGMRLGELRALKWASVDLDAGELHVRLTAKRRPKEDGGGVTLGRPKTEKSVRRISLGADVVRHLRAHRARQHEERLRAGVVWQDHDLVFASTHGTILSVWALMTRNFYPLLERAAVRRVRFHDLRHTAATLALSAGMDVKTVSEMLGHSSVTITLDVYAHVLPDMRRRVADVMGTILFG